MSFIVDEMLKLLDGSSTEHNNCARTDKEQPKEKDASEAKVDF